MVGGVGHGRRWVVGLGMAGDGRWGWEWQAMKCTLGLESLVGLMGHTRGGSSMTEDSAPGDGSRNSMTHCHGSMRAQSPSI